jgi:hypothetical protein
LLEDAGGAATIDLPDKEDQDTPLHLAARVGDLGLVQLLLGHGANATLRNCMGRTAAHIAVALGFVEVVAALLEDARWNALIDMRDERDYTLLDLALGLEPRIELVELLLSRGANPSLQNGNGYTAVLLAVKQGHVSITSVLLEDARGPAAVNLGTLPDFITPLHLEWAREAWSWSNCCCSMGQTQCSETGRGKALCTLLLIVAVSRSCPHFWRTLVWPPLWLVACGTRMTSRPCTCQP